MCLGVGGVYAAENEPASRAPLSAEAFFQRPAIRDIKLSPSGRQLAFTTAKGLEHVGLAVMNLDGEPKTHWVAAFSDADVREFHWVNDERLVYTAIELDEGSASDYYVAPGLYAAKSDGTQQRQLVRRQSQPFVMDGSQPNKDLLPWNHVLLATPWNAGNEVIIGRLEVYRGEVVDITPLRLDVRTGRTKALEIKGAPHQVKRWLFDNRGEPHVAITFKDDKEAVYWRDEQTDEWRKLTEAPAFKLQFMPVGWDDKGTLYVTRRFGAGQWTAMTRFDFGKNEPEADNIVSAPGFDIDPHLLFDDDKQSLLGVRMDTDAESTHWWNPEMKAIQKRVDALLPAWINRLECRHCSSPDRVVLVRSFSAQDPGRLWLFHANREGREALQTINVFLPNIPPMDMATKAIERIQARDGRDLPVWLTFPPHHQEGHPLATVVMVHGGPYTRGGHWRWDPMTQFLASRGYLVIEPDFRGSTGYGLVHERASFKQWGQTMQADVADALLWAQHKGYASDKACIMGASYGGYAVLMGLVRDPQLYRCGVEWVGVADLELLVKGSWWVSDDISDSGRRIFLPERVGKLPEDAAMIAANNPVLLADRIKAPLLMAYGDGDKRVPIAHGKRMRDALEKAGHPPEWIVYEGEGHGWRTLEHNVDFAKRVEAFLARNLPAEP